MQRSNQSSWDLPAYDLQYRRATNHTLHCRSHKSCFLHCFGFWSSYPWPDPFSGLVNENTTIAVEVIWCCKAAKPSTLNSSVISCDARTWLDFGRISHLRRPDSYLPYAESNVASFWCFKWAGTLFCAYNTSNMTVKTDVLCADKMSRWQDFTTNLPGDALYRRLHTKCISV